MNRRPRSEPRSARDDLRGRRRPRRRARSSGSSVTSFFIRQSASIESQLRSVDRVLEPARAASASTSPRVSSMTARRLSVAESWAKLSIQWIFQWRSWMSIASSSSTASSARLMPSSGRAPPRGTRSCAPSRAEAVAPPVGEVARRRPAARRRGTRPIVAGVGRVARHARAVRGRSYSVASRAARARPGSPPCTRSR